MQTNEETWLQRVADGHGWLSSRAGEDLSGTDAVLQFGFAVLAYALMEERWLFDLSTLLDPAVVGRFTEEHQELAEDLKLLESLSEGTAEDSDRAVLAASIVRRLREHVSREERLIYAPLRRRGLGAGSRPTKVGASG